MSSPAVDRDALVELLDENADVIVTIIDSFLDDC
ncbi:MAG: Hpt domain-containing protein, partial [Bacteroidetes bacterium SW_7_64_58]